MSAVNHTTARVFNAAIQILWQDDMKFDEVLLTVTDDARYMKRAAGLSVGYPKLTAYRLRIGTAHALHRVCETIRVLYPNVNKLLASGMKISMKSQDAIELLKDKSKDISPPLQETSVITRCRTCLHATEYYKKKLNLLLCNIWIWLQEVFTATNNIIFKHPVVFIYTFIHKIYNL
jgi:hypothetical protein